MRPGINDIKENCIMHSFSQLEPKNSIYGDQHLASILVELTTFGCSKQHLNNTRVWYLNSWISSRSERPDHVSIGVFLEDQS